MNVRSHAPYGRVPDEVAALEQTGTITKLVRLASPTLANEPAEVDGYGIIRGSDGHDVYFFNSAVQGCRFDQLISGQEVRYCMEEGPISLAVNVVPSNDHMGPTH